MEISLPVTLAVLGAALLHAGWNALVKASADKRLDTVAVSAGAGLIALAIAPWLPAPAPESWPWLAGSAAVHILYFLFLAGAYRHGELSYAYPVMRGGGPVIVALVGAVAFNELLSLEEISGVALICAGILGFASGSHDRRATLFAVANAVVIAAYTLVDGQGARASGAPVSYTLWFFVANGIVITAVGGACSLAAYGIALWAMTRAPIALVAVLRETSVIFAAAIGALLLKEKFTRRRLFATGAVMLGLGALRL